MRNIDTDTKNWIRTVADERAAQAGMVFDGERGEWMCNWVESHCCLYEGEYAGQPMILLPPWRDFFMRLYSWVRKSDEWKQYIRRFTHASFWGAKKNGKSPNCAAHNLYLLCGDGEKGQKVYQGAANGQQAGIAQTHAIMMVRQSPSLANECKINNSTMQVCHYPTNSFLSILTGDDSRGAKAKEGLNGSVSYDEMHVVNREVEERTSRAGISRKEPIVAAFSTAGDDPSSIGHERFEWGEKVNRGEVVDPHFLHVNYSAPEKVTDAQIDERLEEFGKLANPAWGTIVKASEFRADWNRCKGKPREVARFKQYRLNLWIGSTNQWLDGGGWDSGLRSFTVDDLRGRECYLGIDLSRTRDMTSVQLLFPFDREGEAVEEVERVEGEAVEGEDDTPKYEGDLRIVSKFWLPEATVRERSKLFPYEKWVADGDLTETPGNVVDYQIVEDETVAMVEDNGLIVKGIYFDKHYAEEITQRLSRRLNLADDERVDVPQTITTLSPLAKEFERLIIKGSVHHCGNAVMTWMIGHCEVKTDANQNIRPVKPNPSSGKSIDGIMAAIDAMAGVLTPPDDGFSTIYDKQPLTVLGANVPLRSNGFTRKGTK